MPDYFQLHEFNKFGLWLHALDCFHEHSGNLFGQSGPAPVERNYVDDVKTSLRIVQDLMLLAEEMGRKELEQIQQNDPTLLVQLDKNPKGQLQRLRSTAARLKGFLTFWDFLGQYKVLSAGLIRLPHFSGQEFKALGCLLSSHIQRFLASDAHQELRRASVDSEFRYLIQRDVVLHLEMPGIRERVEVILVEFFQILRLIRYIGDEMKVRFQVRKLMVLFGYCYRSYLSFTRLLNDSRDYLDRYQPEIVDAIFSTTFALKMETRKVFKERLETIGPNMPVKKVYAEMEDALGLIRNAFQECFINLIQLLNPAFDEGRLFDDLRQRYEETLRLLDDLVLMHRLAGEARASGRGEDWEEVRKTLKRFDQTSKKRLFFKDWQDFEDFDQEFDGCEAGQRKFALHRFEIFLTTLICEVRKRTVLSKFGPAKASSQLAVGRSQQKLPRRTVEQGGFATEASS
ncbi:MAG: hypothetical protein V3T83_19415 [Acidobacteriota bacterium]